MTEQQRMLYELRRTAALLKMLGWSRREISDHVAEGTRIRLARAEA